MHEPLLHIEGLKSGYGDVQVLWGIDLSVSAGEIACIVGSNGAGKTTLLRTISGVVKPTSGSIRFAAEAIEKADPEAILHRGIAHVPEGRRLFKGLSVRDNLLLGAHLRRDRGGIASDLERVFDIFPILAERRAQDATTLSGGEQQMCAVGRGIMSQPRLLMLDELSLGLAPQAVERIAVALVAINKAGITILLVEQDVLTAFELAQHGFVIELGRIAMSGETRVLAQDDRIRQAYMGI
jgi:branched-chain amino acid transport system ATP-binding protein